MDRHMQHAVFHTIAFLAFSCLAFSASPFRAALLFPRDYLHTGWLGSRVVSVLDSGAEGPGFKSQPRRCRVTVLGKLFTPLVPLFTKQRN